MSQTTKPAAILFAVLYIQTTQGAKPVLEARLDSAIQIIVAPNGLQEPDLKSCPEGTTKVVRGLKATQAAQLMATHVTTVRRQAERAASRAAGVPTQYERERPYRQAQQETRRRSLALMA
ncbi:hypothetical protein [Hymenobacter sp. DG01]|uniref:hypothetical protein n=1 Tax=Hymenobacter sp. DG01 TaxID=2584940 RepID=UPI00111D72D1|nr:hypothetical protein [Hymenobacter sp. DG01]